MKRQNPSQSRGNITPRINTPNNHDFIQDYFSAHHQPFSPAKNVDNNMYNNMYYPNNQMIPQNNGPMYNNAVEGMENFELNDNANNKQKWDMSRGMTTPTTPIHPMNDMNQFNIPVPFRNGYEMYGDPQQPLLTPPPYMRSNGPFINGGHRGNEEMMVGMNHVMKDQNNNLLSPVVMENTGGAQNNKKANLYKTELCRSYEETGQCRYGSKCQFAHSEKELRHVDRHPKYKTEMCKTFWEQGTCPYGKRCCFIHTPRDLTKKEDAPGTHTPTTPAKTNDKKTLPDATVNIPKKKENSVDNVNNNLSEGETLAIASEEGENTTNNRSRSGSDSVTAASITEEIISNDGEQEEEKKEKKKTDDKEKKSEESKETPVSEGKKEASEKTKAKNEESGSSVSTPAVAVPIKSGNKNGETKGLASSFEPMAKTPTNQTFNYSNSFGNTMNMMNNGYVPHRKMSSPPQRQNPRINNPSSKSLNLNVDINSKYNNVLGMNSMSFNPTSPLDSDFMFNNNHGEMNGKMMGHHGMSTSLPANDLLDEKMMYKLQNLHIQTTPPHTPINGQRTNQNNQGMISPLSSSFNNQNNIFMKQPLMINTSQNNSNLFLKQTTGSPFTPGTTGSFLSPKQTHVGGLPPIPLIDDELPNLKRSGSLSGKGSDFDDDVDDIVNTPSTPNNNLFVKQAISTPKNGTPHSILKPTTPKNASLLPSTPQSISSSFLNSGSVSPLQSRMGTSLPTTPLHANKFNPSAIDEVFSGNNNIINDFSRTTSSGINVAASPFTPTNDLSQYMMQMSSARESTGIQSLENIKSPSQLFYRPSSGSINAINTTSSMKSNGGFSMNMGGIGMPKNRSESFDYGMLSPNGMNSYLSAGNPISSPVNGYNNSLASSFSNSFMNSKVRSESVDFGQISNFNKDNNMVGSMPTFSFLQSINEGVPDSPFSNHGSLHGSPLPSSTTTLNDLTSGMNDFIGAGRRKSFQDASLMSNRLPTVPEVKQPSVAEEEEDRLFSNNTLTDEGILKFSKEHFGLDDAHSKSLLGNQGSNAMDIKGSILGGNLFTSMSPTSTSHNFF